MGVCKAGGERDREGDGHFKIVGKRRVSQIVRGKCFRWHALRFGRRDDLLAAFPVWVNAGHAEEIKLELLPEPWEEILAFWVGEKHPHGCLNGKRRLLIERIEGRVELRRRILRNGRQILRDDIVQERRQSLFDLSCYYPVFKDGEFPPGE